MFASRTATSLAVALCLSLVHGCRDHLLTLRRTGTDGEELINSHQTLMPRHAELAPLVEVSLNQATVNVNTSSAVAVPGVAEAAAVSGTAVSATVLVIARDKTSAYSAYSGLNDYGIPYQVLIVPPGGTALPSLNESATQGNFGLIIIQSEVSYLNNKTNVYASALTDAQWTTLYNYQVSYGVRMVRLDVAPGPTTGTASLGGCCTKEDQLISISNDAGFTTAGLQTNAGITTAGLYHYPANITDKSIATEFAQFDVAASDGFKTKTTAGVINKIGGREQMVFFITFSTDWSLASNFLQHAYIHWGTRGLCTILSNVGTIVRVNANLCIDSGFRRAMMTAQIDDMFLETPLYDHNTTNFRVRTPDMDNHLVWIDTVTTKLNAGSSWFLEIGHNGNGNIESAIAVHGDSEGETLCKPGAIDYPDQIDTPLEWAKPPGTGTDIWPSSLKTYAKDGKYSRDCTDSDELLTWFQLTWNMDFFAHMSHTFSHQDENNATYADVLREIQWNEAWLKSVGLSKAKRFSPKGIIPPAITGMNNGDAIRGWVDAGVKYVVGDNTRAKLMNAENEHWPLMTSVATNGYAGIQITPRWASNIYYNCDLPACTVAEWQKFSSGKGTFDDLLTLEKNTNTRHLLGLHHDPFMFHQANLRVDDVADTIVNGVKGQYSLLMAWVDTVVAEYLRLVKWPLISQKHDDLGLTFAARQVRDQCKPSLSWNVDFTQNIITGATLTAKDTNCKEKIPLTLPGTVRDVRGATKEQLGSDPLTLWVPLSGKPVSFTFTTPIALKG
ncbi:hypothetical protein BJ875DRAFT_112514 [Amylocarpus encephaloides]|uniref:Extracellular serine-rich protein n=1 Tax=Amylocarpus encephaloides TaxID=45428 RepID=A0A9P7YEL2_9HELO|nr:hypothetical protein BJ875DRAFT_112514 [Amylocarpus encephaloides]